MHPSRKYRAHVLWLAATMLAFQSTHSQGIEGQWKGAIAVAGTEIGIFVQFQRAGDSLAATIDIPQQGAKNLRLTAVRWQSPGVHFELPAGPGLAVFDGVILADSIEGVFTQAGFAGTFHMRRAGPLEAEALPAEHIPYNEEEVVFHNGAITLAGTLTLPRDSARHPAVVMITGSGPQNRDEELLGFKAFRIIADDFTRHGIIVLRYDDRGVGGSSGNTLDATTADFADDVAAAVQFLRTRPEVDRDHIGLLGHSEGGVVAPMVASRSHDVGFIILLAGTAVPGDTIVRFQAAALARARGASGEKIAEVVAQQRRMQDAVLHDSGGDEVMREIRAAAAKTLEAMSPEQRAAVKDSAEAVQAIVNAQLKSLKSPWFKYFLQYDPAPALEKVTCPVLAVFGALDMQVPVALNRPPLEAALRRGGNKDFTIDVIPGANHLFIPAVTGSPLEYLELKKEFVPGLLDTLHTWILRHAAESRGVKWD